MSSISKYFACSNKSYSQISLSSAFRLCNPDYFQDISTFNDYVAPNFRKVSYEVHSHFCAVRPIDIFLPLTSKVYDQLVSVTITSLDTVDVGFIDILDIYLAYGHKPTRKMNIYNMFLIFVLGVELSRNISTKFNYKSAFKDFIFDEKNRYRKLAEIVQLEEALQDLFIFDSSIFDSPSKFNKSFVCKCYKNTTLEPTGLFEAIGGTAYGTYHALTYGMHRDVSEDLKKGAVDIAIDFTNLYVNFNVKTILLTILRIINKFIPLTQFVGPFFNMVKHLISSLFELIPIGTTPQASNTVGNTLETTFNVETIFEGINLTDITSYLEQQGTNLLTIISVFAAAIVTIASFYACKELKINKESKLYTLNLANTMYNMHKFKTGISATIDMFKSLIVYIEEAIKSLLCINDEDLFTRYLAIIDTRVVEGLCKFKFLDYATELLDPSNKELILINEKLSEKLDFCCHIIDKLYFYVSIKATQVKSSLIGFITKFRTDLFALLAYRVRSKSDEFYREVPYCISLIGPPGTGKSVFMPKLAEAILMALERLNVSLPPRDSWMYSVNFTDRYMTKYSQQYCVMVDDAFQDSSPLGERSSALDLISWISCIPHYTNQAGVNEKGIPFKSNLVILTTNTERPIRMEITQPEALYRRFHKSLIFEKCECHTVANGVKTMTPCNYPFIQKGFHIKKYNVLSGLKTSETIGSEEFIIECVKDIMAWQKHQRELFQEQRPSEEFVQNIVEKCKQIVSPTQNEPVNTTLETTGFIDDIRCKTGYVRIEHVSKAFMVKDQDERSHQKVPLYDCKCQFHCAINVRYMSYRETIAFLGTRSEDEILMGIEDYRDFMHDEAFRIKTVKQRIEECLKKFLAIITGAKFKCIAAGIGMAVVALGAFALVNKDPETLENTKASYVTKIKKPIVKKATLTPTSGNGDYSGALTMLEHLKNRRVVCQIVKNIKNEDGSIQRLTCVCIRLKGTFILFNDHIRREFEDGHEFEIWIPNKGSAPSIVRQIFNKDNYEQIGEIDAGIYKCDNKMQCATDIVNHFSDDEVEVVPKRAMLQTWIQGVPETIPSLMATPITKKWTITTDDGLKVYDLLHSYSINTTILRGMSGSLLVCADNRTKNKFMGIQCARGSAPEYTGYCVPLSRKMIEDTLEKFQTVLELSIDHHETLQTVCSIECIKPSNFVGKELLYVGDISNKNKIVRQALKTSLKPSLIHDPETLTQEPSVLSNTDMRLSEEEYGKSIIYKAMKGYDEDIGAVDTKVLDEVVNSLGEEYAYQMRDIEYEPRLLNDFEMVNGIPKFLKRLNMKTSPGYPCVVEKKTGLGGKYEWFDELIQDLPEGYGKAYIMKAELKGWLEQIEHEMGQGKIPPIIAYACLKDETRPLHKITEGTTRAFLCLPLAYNLLIRKYFGLFVGNQHLHAGVISSCVGIDPAKQWIKVANKLLAKNDKWEDFDYKNWDQHLHPELIMRVAQIVNRWYGADDNSQEGLIRRVLLYCLCHTYVIVNGKVFQKGVGQCSGCAITAELNCLVHDILMFYTWTMMHRKKGLNTCLDEYRENVANILYGDDIVQAVDPDYDQISFTGNEIAPYMDLLGMRITPGDKVSTTFESKSPQDILFLKRGFLYDNHKWKAPLRQDILENIPQWIHKSDNDIIATEVNCEMALQESFMHGESYFNELRNSLNKRIYKYNIENNANMKSLTKTYLYYDRMYNNEEYICLGMPNDATLSDSYMEE